MAILGIDEVGRGPWAGPLVVGAAILPEEKPKWCDDLTDSKKLSVKKREALNEIILKEAPAVGLGWVSSAEIDEIGLSDALKLAARRAIKSVQAFHIPFSEIVIDGTVNFLTGTKLEKYVTVLKKADFLVKEVSAASIIAKVARDHYMYELSNKYPEYGFEKHVGYGTFAHKKALEYYGTCPEHRCSFRPIAEICGKNQKQQLKNKNNTTNIGAQAEDTVAVFLEQQGHQIIARNHKTKFYEIDIISVFLDKIYFTEVKYRKSNIHGTALEMITPAKLRQMTFAAESFLKYQPKIAQKFNPQLAAASVSGEEFRIDSWQPLL